MEMVRCKHFSLEAEEIYVSGAPVMLRVPIRRCVLAERMIDYISQTARGKQVAQKLCIAPIAYDSQVAPYTVDQALSAQAETASETEAEVAKAEFRAAFGPDLEAIHHLECTVQRCKESCTPSYKMMLEHFDLHHLADPETGAGCLGTSD